MTGVAGDITPEDAEGHVWDVLVVGTGAGGATAGYNLARLGHSVLFVERGKLVHHDPSVVRGVAWGGQSETALQHGWWPHPAYFHREQAGSAIRTMPPIGSGTGGSTTQFGAVMERLRPEDFTPRRFYRDMPDSHLPEAWPVSYGEMVPFYERAESLFRVRGTQDKLASSTSHLMQPPPASDREVAVVGALNGAGLSPYRMHSALERVPGCAGCPAMLCPNACRNDAARICLHPAIERHGARILSNCRAIRFEETGREVKRVICEQDQKTVSLRSRVFILAASAFLTPAILQQSANERFPDGLANSSGLVGRNLMLHASDVLMTRLKGASRALGFGLNHGVSLNDFYVHDGTKLGNIHAHPTLNRNDIMAFLRLHRRPFNHLPQSLLSAAAAAGLVMYRSWTAFATVVEDLPYSGNFVTAKRDAPGEIEYTYQYPAELGDRARRLREAFKGALGRAFDVRPLRPSGMLNRGHACGTCRFGDDPKTSVLDRDNRAHDLDNLYVVDASFFPSSGGINPSLTIVANSLRATDKVAQRL